MAAFGFDFNFEPWETAAISTSHLTSQFILFMFFFMVMNKLGIGGMDKKAGAGVCFLLALLYQAPTFISFCATGVIDVVMMITGLVANSLILVILMSVLFNLHRNIISAVLIETMIMVMLKAIGLI